MNRKRGRSEATDSEDKENCFDKRIKRLEELLLRKEKRKERKKKRRHRHSSRCSQYSPDSLHSHEGLQSQMSIQSFNINEPGGEDEPEHSQQSDTVQDTQRDHSTAPVMQIAENMGQIDRPAPPQAPESQIHEDQGEVVLDPKILEVMGKRFLEDRSLAAAIPKDLGIPWEEILKSGMPSEDRVALIKKYPPPKNCFIIDPPKINPEVRASLQDTIIKRDERIEAKQAKIAACLAAVGKNFLSVLKRHSGHDNLDIVEQLSDIGRLLSDLQHDESNIRKSLILANLSAPFKDVLNGTTPDELLFGKQLQERLKTAKALENCKKDLRPASKFQNNNVSKNSKFPPRRSQENQRQVSSALGGKKRQNTKAQHASTNRRGNQRHENNWKTNQRYDNHRQRRY